MDRIDIKLDYACNNHCLFCVVSPEERNVPSIPPERIQRELRIAKEGGATEVAFTGGEPTIRKTMLGFVSYARNLGYRSVLVMTNGRMLSNASFARAAKEAGVTSFMISVHGTENVHDHLTDSKGSFAQVMQGISNLRNERIRFITDTVITSKNIKDIPALIGMLLDLGSEVCQLDFIIPCGSAWNNKELIPKMTEAMPAISGAIDIGKEKGKENAIVVMGMAPCVMGDYRRFMNEPNIPRIAIVSAERSHQTSDYNIHRKKGKIMPETCKQCAWYNRCEGVWAHYAELHGTEELIPL